MSAPDSNWMSRTSPQYRLEVERAKLRAITQKLADIQLEICVTNRSELLRLLRESVSVAARIDNLHKLSRMLS